MNSPIGCSRKIENTNTAGALYATSILMTTLLCPTVPPPHNTVALNVAAGLHGLLKGRQCQAFIADMMVRVEADNVGYYPDVMVTCSKEDRTRESFKTDPLLIVEVLSSSTAAYDRGKKFASYRKIASLQHVVFIDPEVNSIDHFQRDGDRRTLLPSGEEGLSFTEIECQMAKVDIFAGVTAISEQASLS